MDFIKELSTSSESRSSPIIILIDDDESCNVSLRLMLHDLNLDIISFIKGKEAINYILSNRLQINLVLLDLMMPDINGLEIVKQIKGHHLTSHLPLILQTGMTEHKFIDEGFEYGMSDYIFKPYTKENIVKIIKLNILP